MTFKFKHFAYLLLTLFVLAVGFGIGSGILADAGGHEHLSGWLEGFSILTFFLVLVSFVLICSATVGDD